MTEKEARQAEKTIRELINLNNKMFEQLKARLDLHEEQIKKLIKELK